MVWDAEGISESHDQVLEQIFESADADSDSESEDKKKTKKKKTSKGKKKESSSEGSSSSSSQVHRAVHNSPGVCPKHMYYRVLESV